MEGSPIDADSIKTRQELEKALQKILDRWRDLITMNKDLDADQPGDIVYAITLVAARIDPGAAKKDFIISTIRKTNDIAFAISMCEQFHRMLSEDLLHQMSDEEKQALKKEEIKNNPDIN